MPGSHWPAIQSRELQVQQETTSQHTEHRRHLRSTVTQLNKDTRKREHVTPQRRPCSLTTKWAGRVDRVLLAQAGRYGVQICAHLQLPGQLKTLSPNTRESRRKTHSTENSGVCTRAHIPSPYNTHHLHLHTTHTKQAAAQKVSHTGNSDEEVQLL